MQKSRNGLLELYRVILSFWPMYFHGFFIVKDNGTFSVAQLTVDFFFIISGFFLLSSMEKLKDERPLVGAWKLMFSRLKPISFTMFVAAAFNAVCMILFIRADFLSVLFEIFCYWWYILYLTVAIGIFYLLFRLIKDKKSYAIFLALLSVSMGILHYFMEERGFFIHEFTYVVRTFGCLAFGVLCSYIPKWKPGKLNVNAVFVAVLFPILLILAYGEKEYWLRIVMIVLFAALVYFSVNVNFGGKFFNILGKLSTRLYIYMALVSMLRVLGVTDYRLLFALDVFLSVMDLTFTYYYKKCKNLALRKQTA